MNLKELLIVLTLGLVFGACSEKNMVEQHGKLSTKNARIVDQYGEAIQLKGMSLFWSNWAGEYYTYNTVKWLHDEWNCSLIRVPMGIIGNDEGAGYMEAPEVEKAKMETVIQAAIDLGIYVIVDWHSHDAEEQLEEAKEFFGYIAKKYGSYPNVMYEPYNEPTKASWDSVVKPYLDEVITEIRKYDPDNIIICGTPTWSQDVDVASLNPIEGDNIAYTVHYYASTHKQYLRDKMDVAMKNGLSLFVTEFGTCNHLGDYPIDTASTKEWFDYLDEHQISWANWSVNHKEEAASILKPDSKTYGWTMEDITESGMIIYKELNK